MTGIYTGRSPKDKFLVMDETSKNTVWWTSDEYKNDNKPVTENAWKVLKDLAVKELSNKRLFVVDCYCGANEATRLKVRFIMEGTLRNQYVYPSFERRVERFRTRFRCLQRFQSESRKLQRTRTELRNGCCLQPYHQRTSYPQYLVWW